MIRAPIGDKKYWEKWTDFSAHSIKISLDALDKPSKNPAYDPQYTLDLAQEYLRLILRLYSRGDIIQELVKHFEGLLDAWELSNHLSDELCAKEHLTTCRDWVFSLGNLNHYIWCFWLVGLALVLDIPDVQWQRLITLIGEEGEDVLLDKIIASRSPNRIIGQKLLHNKPYSRLLKAINAPKEQQAVLLKEFVDHWYIELDRRGDQQPYWYIYGDPQKHPLKMGSYFGRWCIEAVAVVKVYCLDDALCLGHEHYPGDLLRPDGPTTHPQKNGSLSDVVFRLLRFN